MSLETAAVGRTQSYAFADAKDFEECRRLHRKFGTSYYFATRLFPAKVRKRTHALYGFVRLPDEWVDNPDASPSEIKARIDDYRGEYLEGLRGVRPTCGVLRAFCDVALAAAIPLEEPLNFLRSMEQDLEVSRYETYPELCGYMRGSASAVGVMMCSVMSDCVDQAALPYAAALGEAMQMTNFLRDIGEDARRGRIYLPSEDLKRFGVDEDQILDGQVTEEFKNLLRFEIARIHDLYTYADQGIELLPPFAHRAVRLASVLYRRILDRIEEADYDVFTRRARTTRTEKIRLAAQLFLT
jgi:phytoene synthase